MASVTFDLGALLAKLQKVGMEAPTLIQQFTAQGMEVPAMLQKAIPYIGMASQMAGKFLTSERDGLTPRGLDLGTQGRGRMSYLRRRKSFSDTEVMAAMAMITDPRLELPNARPMVSMITYTLACMYPGDEGMWTEAQHRRAVDQLLEVDGLPEGVCDRLGDLLYHLLTKPPHKGIETKSDIQDKEPTSEE